MLSRKVFVFWPACSLVSVPWRLAVSGRRQVVALCEALEGVAVRCDTNEWSLSLSLRCLCSAL